MVSVRLLPQICCALAAATLLCCQSALPLGLHVSMLAVSHVSSERKHPYVIRARAQAYVIRARACAREARPHRSSSKRTFLTCAWHTRTRVWRGSDRGRVPHERTRHIHTLVELVLLPLLCVVSCCHLACPHLLCPCWLSILPPLLRRVRGLRRVRWLLGSGPCPGLLAARPRALGLAQQACCIRRFRCFRCFRGFRWVAAVRVCPCNQAKWRWCVRLLRRHTAQTCSPLVSFMLYFCFWHSVRHILCVAACTFDALR